MQYAILHLTTVYCWLLHESGELVEFHHMNAKTSYKLPLHASATLVVSLPALQHRGFRGLAHSSPSCTQTCHKPLYRKSGGKCPQTVKELMCCSRPLKTGLLKTIADLQLELAKKQRRLELKIWPEIHSNYLTPSGKRTTDARPGRWCIPAKMPGRVAFATCAVCKWRRPRLGALSNEKPSMETQENGGTVDVAKLFYLWLRSTCTPSTAVYWRQPLRFFPTLRFTIFSRKAHRAQGQFNIPNSAEQHGWPNYSRTLNSVLVLQSALLLSQVSIRVSLCLSVSVSVSVSVCVSLSLSLLFSAPLSLSLSLLPLYLPIYLPIYLSIYLSYLFYLSVYLCIHMY